MQVADYVAVGCTLCHACCWSPVIIVRAISMKRKQNDDKQRTISSFFTAAPKRTNKPQQQLQRALQPYAAEAPHAKRRKPDDDMEVIHISDDQHMSASASPSAQNKLGASGAASTLAGPAVEELTAAIPATRDHARHKKAQHKLVGAPGATSLAEPGAHVSDSSTANETTAAGCGNLRKQQQPKYTPLEQQVVALKAAYPGVLLVVEVGYKMRFFGEDAQIASQELGIYAYPDHNFLTASIPVQRLPIHVRRLVAAGHKVGLVRQVESAALKAASDNRSAPFTRSLTGLYTAATLDAAEKADKVGDASAIEASQELELLLGQGSKAGTGANYVLVVAEQQQQQHSDPGDSTGEGVNRTRAATGGSSSSSSRSGTGLLGVLAVDVGSGDIAYAVCSSSSSSSSGGGVVIPLEAVLLSIAPAEIVVCEPISAATNRQLISYMAGHGGRRCRLEHLQQQQQRPGSSKELATAGAAVTGGGGDCSAGVSYLDAATLQMLQQFYGCSSSNSSSTSSQLAPAAVVTGATAPSQEGSAAKVQANSEDVQFVLSLPHLVLLALAGAIQHLTAFNLTGVLRCTSGFRALNGVGANMLLDGNALRQLEVLAAGGDGRQSKQGSLLHLIDRSATAAGGRLLRRWLAAPLADKPLIADRQDAVAALLAAAGGSSSSSTDHAAAAANSSAVLQRIPAWLTSIKQDLERSLSRVAAGTASPAEAVGLWTALAELHKSLQLPLQQETQQLDLDSLAAAVPSRLLLSLLAAAASPAAAAAAQQTLSWLNVKAAAKNDYLGLFESEQQFPEVFACAAAVKLADSHLHRLLPSLAAAAGVPSLSYVSIQNQGAWLVELPAGRTNIPEGWVKVCGTKKVCRYHPPEVKTGMAALARAQEQQAATVHAAWQQLLADFSAQHHAACRGAVSAVAQLDALQALASLAATPGYTRPEFVDESEPQQLLIEDGKHPMLDLALDGGAVGNTLELGWDGTRAAIVTGPNMGGKSVLIRQAALTIIMAQLGGWVHASRCRLSVFDGVFCRMGATDCLIAGRSTFAEELGDASYILGTATNRSLVIMDELGRGTATHDGVAVASATLTHLVHAKQCLTLFVTHYPEVAALARSSSSSSSNNKGGSSSSKRGSSSSSSSSNHIAVNHMAYVRHGSEATAATAAALAGATNTADGVRTSTAVTAAAPPMITFLYKLTAGPADASFGLNVAQMAGLPQCVVHRAAIIAAQLKGRLGPAAHRQQQLQQCGGQEQQQELMLLTIIQKMKWYAQQLQAGAACQRSKGRQQQQQQQLHVSFVEAHQQILDMQRSVSQMLQAAT